MSKKLFYHATTRKLIATFGAIFNELRIQFEKGASPYLVPIRFSNREKFLSMLDDVPDPYSTVSQKQTVWMAFDLTGLNYASERATNNTHRIKRSVSDSEAFMYNRVPYDLSFQLYVSSKQLEPSLMILEQILPIFKPSFNITVDEIETFKLDTDISITLDSITPEHEYEGSITEQRNIFWTLGFTMKAWYYPIIEKKEVIKRVEAVLRNLEEKGKERDNQDWLMEYTSEVNPFTANRHEDYEIKDSVIVNTKP